MQEIESMAERLTPRVRKTKDSRPGRDRAGGPPQHLHGGRIGCNDHLGRALDQLCRITTDEVRIDCAPAIFNVQVAALGPPESLEFLAQRCRAHPEVASLVAAMLQARDAVERRSWAHPQEPTGEEWWADVLADPRARKRERRTDLAVKRAFYRLADETRETILVACSKCDWRAAFSRDDLIASHGADYAMPNLLNHLAAPSCSRLGSHWDRCGVHYVEPIEGAR
jgi:hypothetical protein